MFPVWFFIVLMVLICYLLLISGELEGSFSVSRKDYLKRIQVWMKKAPEKQKA